jgi:hypothetical protein
MIRFASSLPAARFPLAQASVVCGVLLAGMSTPGEALAQTMGGLHRALPASTPPPLVGNEASQATAHPHPARRDLDSAAPQNIRPPCHCEQPRHPSLEPRAVIMFQPASVSADARPAVPSGPTALESTAPDGPAAPAMDSLQPGHPDPAGGWYRPERYSVAWQAERDARTDAAPAATSSGMDGAGGPREPRGPFRRIFEDTRDAVRHDLPEALADSLPWVDRERKDVPFEAVLGRVSDELARADAADPEWAMAAEDELRELAARLDTLSAPPPMPQSGEPLSGSSAAGATASAQASGLQQGRPFRPRPVWPGATVTSEPQRRPATLTTSGLEESGPVASGTSASWQGAPDLAPPAHPAAPARRTGRRR